MLVKHTNEDETKIIFIDDFTYKATHIFNANAFPDSLKGEIGACVTRMRIFQHSVREVCVQISKDYEVFHNILDENIDDLTESAISRPDLSLVCLNDNVNHISSMCSSLIFLKSFLDIYSKVIVHSIKSGQSMQFDKSVVNAGEEKISGGKLIKWLRNSAPTQYQELSDIIFRNSVDWISLAIKYRVVLVHKGDLPELYGMRVPLRPSAHLSQLVVTA